MITTSRSFKYQRMIESESPFSWRITCEAFVAAYGKAMLDGFAKVHPHADRDALHVAPALWEEDGSTDGFTVFEGDIAVACMTERAFLLYALEGVND